MKIVLTALMLSLFCRGTFAAESPFVPRCWTSDQPGEQIQDGVFRVFIPTAHTRALEVAMVIGILSQSLAEQQAVGVSPTGDRIELDVFGQLKYWRPTAAFPTLNSFKSAILATLTPVLSLKGVSIECAPVDRHYPSP